VLVKAVEDAALGMASVYRAIGVPLRSTMPNAGDQELRAFQQLLAEYMPFDLVIDEETANGDEARVSKTSVCGSWGAIGGEIRYFADKLGIPRASIEGTQLPMDLVRRHARASESELVFDPARKRAPLALRRRVEYFGFDLGRELEAIEEFPSELRDKSRRLLAEAMASTEARHAAVKRNQPLIDVIRETWRRSGGKTPRLGVSELTALYESRLRDVNSLTDFKHAELDLTSALDALVPAAVRAVYQELPDRVFVRDRDVDIQYDVEEGEGEKGSVGVARLRLPEKLARTLTEAELPPLDRPLRFIVTRGARGAARATTLSALQDELERPFTEEELAAMNRAWEARREERRDRKRRRREGRGGEANGDAEDQGARHRRRQRPGRRERAAQRETPDTGPPPNESERRGPRATSVEGERNEQPRRRGGLRGRRGPRWR
jgi:hypothetical protein